MVLSPERSLALLLDGQPHIIIICLSLDACLPLTLQNHGTAGIRLGCASHTIIIALHVQDKRVSPC